MQLRSISVRVALAANVFCSLACGAPPESRAPKADPATPEADPATARAPAAPAPPPSPPPEQPAVGARQVPDRVENITIDPHPHCGPGEDAMSAGRSDAWLRPPAMQSAVYALDAVLKPFAASQIGTTFDHDRRIAIVVFHTDFRDYTGVRERLRSKVAPLEVVLAPGCHTRAQIAEAETVLMQRAWHPEAKTTNIGFHLDASFAGFSVTVDDSAPQVAEALRKRLGPLVKVSLGKPRRT